MNAGVFPSSYELIQAVIAERFNLMNLNLIQHLSTHSKVNYKQEYL